MDNLLTRISKITQVLQDYICMYNLEHRRMTRFEPSSTCACYTLKMDALLYHNSLYYCSEWYDHEY